MNSRYSYVLLFLFTSIQIAWPNYPGNSVDVGYLNNINLGHTIVPIDKESVNSKISMQQFQDVLKNLAKCLICVEINLYSERGRKGQNFENLPHIYSVACS